MKGCGIANAQSWKLFWSEWRTAAPYVRGGKFNGLHADASHLCTGY
ncbi:hypothetical protein OK074_1048 [Actinobacteria bacterium OK074]|nr:hypothetical protein OK074_1048 [Actinobacteria bacterium OK074]